MRKKESLKLTLINAWNVYLYRILRYITNASEFIRLGEAFMYEQDRRKCDNEMIIFNCHPSSKEGMVHCDFYAFGCFHTFERVTESFVSTRLRTLRTIIYQNLV